MRATISVIATKSTATSAAQRGATGVLEEVSAHARRIAPDSA